MKGFTPIATNEHVEIFNKLPEYLDEDQLNAIIAWGSDIYSKSLLGGSLLTLGFASIPTIIFVLNRLLRETPKL